MRYDRDTSPGYLTNWAARLFARAIERRLSGGSSGPMPVYFALQDGRAMTQKSLAQLAAVEQPTMANTLSRMDRDGLVTRTTDPNDRRSALIRLTDLGRSRADQAFASALEVNGIAEAALSEAELSTYLDCVRRIIAALENDGAAESR